MLPPPDIPAMTRTQAIPLAGLLLALGVLVFAPFDYAWRSAIIDAAMGRATTYQGRTSGPLWAPPSVLDVQGEMRAAAERDQRKAAWVLAEVSEIRPAWGPLVGRLALVAILTAIALVLVPSRGATLPDLHSARGAR